MFNDADAVMGSTSVLITEALWTSQFGRHPAVVGRRVALDGQPHAIVGVLSNQLRYPEASAAVWKPLDVRTVGASRRRVQTLVIRRPEVSMERLRARLTSISLTLRDDGTLPAAQSLLFDDVVQVRISRNSGRPLWLIFAAVSLVLMVACVNVSNLFLVRASNRRGELAILSAVGADRAALMRQVATEVALLGSAGVIAGIGLAAALIQAMPWLLPEQMGFLTSTPAHLNWPVIGFASAVGIAVSLLAAVAPAWRSSHIDVIEAIKWQSRSVAGRSDERWQGALLALQLATVVVLLGGSGLLLRSFNRLTDVDPGYDAAALAQISIELPTSRYPKGGAALAVMEDLARQVEDVDLGQAALTKGTAISFEIRPEAEAGMAVDAAGMVLPWTSVSPDYFDTMGIPVLLGRTFDPSEGTSVMVVNDRLARRFWGEQSPIGRRFRLDADEPWRTVVGVVGDVRMMGLDDPTGHGMEFYLPHARREAGGGYTLVVRSPRDASVVVSRVKELLWVIDPDAPVVEAGSMRDDLLGSLYRQRFLLRLTTAFAVIALLIAAVGVYGVTTYWVSRRRRDLALRVAVGATRRHIIQLVLTRTAYVALAGGVFGAIGLAVSFPAIRSVLYETDGGDPLVLVGTTVVIGALVGIASVRPARTALAVDPAMLLRHD
jgi:predicted permease